MQPLPRDDMQARYELFNRFALTDQRNYYKRTIDKYSKSAKQVNLIRALMALITAVASALAGLLLATNFTSGGMCNVETITRTGVHPESCGVLQFTISFLILLSIVMPAFGGFFTSLADLFQWDRLISIYDSAVENIEVADSRSPDDEMDDLDYRASLRAFVEGTLQVMSDETAQWGQSVRTPRAIEEFIQEEREKAAKYGGDADANRTSEDE